MDKNEALKLDNQLCFSLYSSSRFVTRAYAPVLEKFELTYPQYLVMLVLWEKDGLTVNQIGDKLYLDSGTLTPLLKRMQATDLISRKRSEEDERKVVIALTPKGKKMKNEAIQIPLAMSEKNTLPIEDLMQLKTQLDKLIREYKK